MPSARRAVAMVVAVVALGAIVASVRTSRSWQAQEPGGKTLREATGSDAGPALLLFADPDCPACEQAVDDLRLEVRPEDFGVRGIVVLRTDPASGAMFEQLGPGLLPAYVLLDEREVTVIRGYRPAAWIRLRLREGSAARSGPGDVRP